MSDWRALLERAIAEDPRGRTGVAEEIGFSRTAVSLVVNGNYIADTRHFAAAVLSRYDRRDCPHTGENVPPEYCRKKALCPAPFGGVSRAAHWRACQTCPHKPLGGKS